MLKVGRYGL